MVTLNGFFLVVDLLFFAANSTKLFEGGWFPLLLAFGVAFLMVTWRTGQRLAERARIRRRLPEETFLRKLAENPPVRLPGTAIVLTPAADGIPLSLTHHLKHNRVMHERLLLVSVLTTEDPRVPQEGRVEVRDLAGGISRVILRYGFMETPHVPGALKRAVAEGRLPGVDLGEVTYYLGRETIIPTKRRRGMAVWREQLYALLSRNAERSAAYFCCPARQVVEIGTELEI